MPHIEIGQRANMSIMGYKNQPFQGVVRSIGWGVYVQDGSGSVSTDLLPAISQTVDWVRLPQRFAVRIEPLGAPPVPLRIGQTVGVAMTPESRARRSAEAKQRRSTLNQELEDSRGQEVQIVLDANFVSTHS